MIERNVTDIPETSLEEKVCFLKSPAAYRPQPAKVEVEETHMSWVFLAGERVYKLKKPVRHSFLDFGSIEAREKNCREELRLNRRLAQDIYLGVAPLTRNDDGRLSIDGEGRPIDWLVVMRRLPRDRMLDSAIIAHTLSRAEIASVAERLVGFYKRAQPADLAPAAYVAQFIEEHARNEAVLTAPEFDLDGGRIERLLGLVEDTLRSGLLEARAESGRIVEGHGDLRPEHVCLSQPPVIIDCLEFNRRLRLVDPVDELTYLGLECSRLGADWVEPVLLSVYVKSSGDDTPSPELVSFYRTYRACLRARLSLVHILEHDQRKPKKWLPLAKQYLDIAASASLSPDVPASQ
jgi:aminoglycoside phosphotransferase family enzyme